MAIVFAAIFLCIVFYAIKNYENGKKHVGVLCYFFFVSHGFYLIPDTVLTGLPINKVADFGTFYLLYILLLKLLTSVKLEQYLKQNREIKLFYLLFIYITGLFLWTIVTGREQFALSLAVYRTSFRFLSFLLFIELNPYQLKWVFKKVFHITAIACVLYVIQPIIGIKTLTGGSVGEIGDMGIARYRNIPYLAYFFLIYFTIRLNFSNSKSIFLLLLFAVSLVLTQHRGIMISYVICIFVYLLINRKIKKMIQYGIIGGFLFLFLGSFVVSRFEKSDTLSDFNTILNMDYQKVAFDEEEGGGTLTFRIMLLLERADYLVRHPKYALQGVGIRHDDSPNTTKEFSFFVCTRKGVNNITTYGQLDSGDLVWATPLIRFGLIGIGLYLIITYHMLRFFFRNRKVSIIASVSLYYYLLLILTSFKNEQLFDAIHLFMIFLIYHLIQRQKQQLNYVQS